MSVSGLEKKLRTHIEGEVFSSQKQLQAYCQDESIFSIEPQYVVSPKHTQDVISLVALSQEYKTPITARGGGTGVAGQSIGSGLIVDFSTHMNSLLDLSTNFAWVQPGVILEELNRKLHLQGLFFAPDPGSKKRCSIGGMVSTNASGPHHLFYGNTRDNILDLEWIGHDQKMVSLNQEKKTLAGLQALMDRNLATTSSIPDVAKNSSGYYIQNIFSQDAKLSDVICGSEGTLGLISSIQCRLSPLPKHRSFAAFSFSSVEEAIEKVEELKSTKASAIELIDLWILEALKSKDERMIEEMGLAHAKASLWVEWEEELSSLHLPSKVFSTGNADMISSIWNFRSQSSKIIHALAKERHPLRCIEDACLPLAKLPEYIKEVEELLRTFDCEGPMFGHVGDGHLHINPQIDVGQNQLSQHVQKLMEEFYRIVLSYGGSISGEHGDGMLRAPYVRKQWASQLDQFAVVKNFFDPFCQFNPGKIITEGNDFPLKAYT
ncbi:MAG: FAD-binding oxidoreductase [Bdellovibrionales bacterium]|nr:FAD-binding oxidoreductase [Bdellovibrionales bacterium]